MASAFLRVEGSTIKNRIWSFLIVHSEYDYSMKDIARYSKAGYTTLKEIWRGFKEKKIVVQTRAVGKAKMYRLNLKNPVVNKFIDYYWAVVDSVVRRENKIKEKENKNNKLEIKEDFKHSTSLGIVVSAKSV